MHKEQVLLKDLNFYYKQGYIVPVLVNVISKTTETEVYDKFAEIRRWDEKLYRI